MKRAIVVIVVVLFAASLWAAPTDFASFQAAYQDFANGIANALPFNALIGLNWSDAYIGGFPNFGAGGTVGMVTMPYKAAAPVIDTLGIGTSGMPDIVRSIGLPIPVWAAEGRIGGFGLPFDIGLKLGYLPPNFQIPGTTNVFVDYLLAGADFRYSLLQGEALVPAVSIGASANFLRGNVYFQGALSGPEQITSLSVGANSWDVQATNPNVDFNWEALVFEAKAQASWNAVLLTPYLGAGLSYAPYAKAGGGLQSQLQVSKNGGAYTNITQSDIDALNAAYPGAFSNLSSTSFVVSASMPPSWSIRAYGGFSLNILIAKLDITGMYNFLDGAFGLSANVRVQL